MASLEDLNKHRWHYQPSLEVKNLTIHRVATHFLNDYGVHVGKQTSRPGAHLPADSEPMKRYRAYVNESNERLGIHPRLIAYWDQICWTV